MSRLVGPRFGAVAAWIPSGKGNGTGAALAQKLVEAGIHPTDRFLVLPQQADPQGNAARLGLDTARAYVILTDQHRAQYEANPSDPDVLRDIEVALENPIRQEEQPSPPDKPTVNFPSVVFNETTGRYTVNGL